MRPIVGSKLPPGQVRDSAQDCESRLKGFRGLWFGVSGFLFRSPKLKIQSSGPDSGLGFWV